MQSGNQVAGLRPLIQLLTVESLATAGEDGRMRPWLAKSWSEAPDHLSVTVKLRPRAKFQDGTPATAQAVAEILGASLRGAMGPAFDDVGSVSATSDEAVRIALRKPSRFVLEALGGETQVTKPGNRTIGTGPFRDSGRRPAVDLPANDDYYLGRPSSSDIAITQYPSVRAAWADLLRDRIDVLYEVPIDALDSLERTSKVSVFAVSRPYQYAIVLNTSSPRLRSSAVRRALNAAIDRPALVREALGGRGILSAGPVWPKNWAFDRDLPKLGLDYARARAELAVVRRPSSEHALLAIQCLVPADSAYERIALIAKQQLEMVGVELAVHEEPPDRISAALDKRAFEAVLIDVLSGPNLFRPYQWWHTNGVANFARFSSPAVDAALDRIRHAASDDEYRAGVAAFQRAMLDDPPAIFLAWSQRARAVSNRFLIPAPESGGDILSTMWEWRLRPGALNADRN